MGSDAKVKHTGWPAWAAWGLVGALALLGLLLGARGPAVRWGLWASAGAGALWLAWLARRAGGFAALDLEVVIRRPHWVQMLTHSSIYVYWGWHVPLVRTQVPLILAQVVFAFLIDALLSWHKRRPWTLGFGPIPIVGSTNLFLWFRDDHYHLQLAMLALAFASRAWLRWRRDGQDVHIFNPSGFGLSVASLGLIVFGHTDYSWGSAIATTLGDAPYMYECIFAAGVVVQLLFGVGLVTLSAVVALMGGGLLVHALTGVWWLENEHIPIAVFLGMHLLVTDPVTSPRGNGAKVLFGALYGLLVVPLYWGLLAVNTPAFYDKLLQVPLLNLLVPALERLGAKLRVPGWPLKPKATQRLQVALWGLTFVAIRGPLRHHPAADPAYWEGACEAGLGAGKKPDDVRACGNIVRAWGTVCEGGAGAACLHLAGLFVEGRLVPSDEAEAVRWFGAACDQGAAEGCARMALAHTEGRGGLPVSAVAADSARERACVLGDGLACVTLAGQWIDGRGGPRQPEKAVALLTDACERNLAQPCGVLGLLRLQGEVVPKDTIGARSAFDSACKLGLSPACAQRDAIPGP